MSVSEVARSYCERIRTRAGNWARGEGYGPGGYPRSNANHDVIFLLQHVTDLECEIADLATEAERNAAWEGRYRALLEEVETSRPRKIQTCGEGMKVGTVVVDSDGYAWQVTKDRIWEVVGGAYDRKTTLDPKWGPYTIIYTPEEES